MGIFAKVLILGGGVVGSALAENLSSCLWSEYNPNWIILLHFWRRTFLLSMVSATKPGPYPEGFTQAKITDLLLRGRCKNRHQMQVQYETLKDIICHFLHY